MEKKKIQVELDIKEYELLCELIHMGEYLVNGHRVDNRVRRYNKILQKIYSLSDDTSILHLSPNSDERWLNDQKGQELYEKYAVEHDDYVFMEILPDKLGLKDAIVKAGTTKFESMSKEEQWDMVMEESEKYDDEIGKHGIMRIGIKE